MTMQMAKRIGLFLMTNVLVMISISIILNVLGVRGYIDQYGINYQSLMIFCLVWGFGGALFSLAISRIMAKFAMGVKVISPQTQNHEEMELLQTVYNLARSAGLKVMPQVGVYDSPELNAFATGPTRNRSLVAVSTGLMNRMDRQELEGVLAHEIAHVANGDMVTMTLVQGVVNAFVMFLARVLAFAIMQAMRKSDDESSSTGGFMQFAITMVLEIVFMIFGTMVVAWFSRYREFRADQGGAKLAGRDSMVKALEKLQRTYEIKDPEAQSPAIAALKISGKSNMMRLFASHPPLEERINRLQTMTSI
jgi:heat shock protein HtpX